MFGASHQCHFLQNIGNFQMLVCRLERDGSSLADVSWGFLDQNPSIKAWK